MVIVKWSVYNFNMNLKEELPHLHRQSSSRMPILLVILLLAVGAHYYHLRLTMADLEAAVQAQAAVQNLKTAELPTNADAMSRLAERITYLGAGQNLGVVLQSIAINGTTVTISGQADNYQAAEAFFRYVRESKFPMYIRQIDLAQQGMKLEFDCVAESAGVNDAAY